MLLAGAIYIRFLFYLKVIYGHKMKEIDFSIPATKFRFCSIFPAVALEKRCINFFLGYESDFSLFSVTFVRYVMVLIKWFYFVIISKIL